MKVEVDLHQSIPKSDIKWDLLTLGVITPEKGAAAFWYNLNSDLKRDFNTRHGGCPVIKGSKWILNKWMFAYDNFVKFPCDMKPSTKFNGPKFPQYF